MMCNASFLIFKKQSNEGMPDANETLIIIALEE